MKVHVSRQYVNYSALFAKNRGKSRAGLRLHLFLYLFIEKCVIIDLRPCPPILLGREVDSMVHLLAILESVVANVMSHYICTWLDRFDKDRKPD